MGALVPLIKGWASRPDAAIAVQVLNAVLIIAGPWAT